jgi:hypothetical protein
MAGVALLVLCPGSEFAVTEFVRFLNDDAGYQAEYFLVFGVVNPDTIAVVDQFCIHIRTLFFTCYCTTFVCYVLMLISGVSFCDCVAAFFLLHKKRTTFVKKHPILGVFWRFCIFAEKLVKHKNTAR